MTTSGVDIKLKQGRKHPVFGSDWKQVGEHMPEDHRAESKSNPNKQNSGNAGKQLNTNICIGIGVGVGILILAIVGSVIAVKVCCKRDSQFEIPIYEIYM